MAHLEPYVTQKGALYSCDCDRCGMTLYTHEWAHGDHNDRRDAMQAGTLHCDDCPGKADPSTFYGPRQTYAGRLSADGYLDCTEWMYDSNKRTLEQALRAEMRME